MSQDIRGTRIPKYSSPFAFWGGQFQGDLENSDVTTLLTDTAATAALFYERKWGYLSSVNASDGVIQSRSLPPPPIHIE